MRVAINGTGIAGPTLAYWLQRYGHEPVLFEKAPALRTGGYIIDFWGHGYDVADKMGLLPRLHALGYALEELRMVGPDGSVDASMKMDALRNAVGGRFVSLPRGDVAKAIFETCGAVDARFGVSVDGIEEASDGVLVTLSDGTRERFDLVVGADGLHSRVRELVFAPESECEHQLGCCVAVFRIEGYRPREELTYVAHTVPGRQVARFALRDDETLVMLICRNEYLAEFPRTPQQTKAALREAFGDVRWEAPALLDHLDRLDGRDLYFDRVSQIRLPAWTKGRVALVGDAAACVSLMAGEGTGLAILEAYVLAGELEKAAGDHQAAFAAYETRLRDLLVSKQKGALRNIGFFVPKTRLGRTIRDWLVSLSSRPFIANRIAASALRDDFTLPEYGPTSEPATADHLTHPEP